MILVTGCTGFVGTHLVNALVENDLPVKCLARSAANVDRLPKERIVFAAGDVTDPESLVRAADGVDTVIHLVGIIREKGNLTFERIHVEGTRNALEAAKAQGVRRFIFMSALGAKERGVTGYQTTKWQAEQLVKASGLEWIIVRPSVIIGKHGEFLATLVDLIKKPPMIPVIGSGEYKLQPLYIGDLTCAFVKMVQDESCWNRIYEFGGPEQLTFNRMIEILKEVLGSRKPMIHLPKAVMGPAIRIMEAILPNPPITSDQFAMLAEDNVTDHNAFTEVFGIESMTFEEALRISLG